jgi:hypothetical protein
MHLTRDEFDREMAAIRAMETQDATRPTPPTLLFHTGYSNTQAAMEIERRERAERRRLINVRGIPFPASRRSR